jgi:hypothetical protein
MALHDFFRQVMAIYQRRKTRKTVKRAVGVSTRDKSDSGKDKSAAVC